MIKRKLSQVVTDAVKQFPAIVVTGPRQSGKTSLVKELFGKSHRYILLEDPDTRALAIADTRGFLQRINQPVILDEFQNVPTLVNYLQGIIDADRTKYGSFILTGSQNFLMMEQVSQSLAGRAAVLSLFPLSLSETGNKLTMAGEVDEWLLRGSFPEPATRKELSTALWFSSFLQTYLEKDVRQIVNIENLAAFERFLRLVAARSGSLMNMSDCARDASVSPTTAQRWLSILETSYQLFKIEAWSTNLSKRIVKSPKYFLVDSGLMCGLCGIQSVETLSTHPLRGHIFETAVVAELLKELACYPLAPQLHFFRTAQGLEADFLLEGPFGILVGEIKSSHTINTNWGENLIEIERLLKKPLIKVVIAPIERSEKLPNGIEIVPLNGTAGLLQALLK